MASALAKAQRSRSFSCSKFMINRGNMRKRSVIDLKKSHDLIPRNKLWAVLLQYGIDSQLLTGFKSQYMHCKVGLCVRVNSVTRNYPFRVSVGLRQGCSFSSILFLIYTDRIVTKSEFCGGVKIDTCTVQPQLFADDLVLLDSTQNGLQQALDKFADASSFAGMKIGSTKTAAMCLPRQPMRRSLRVSGVPLKQSEKFNYLSISFTSDGRQNSELNIHIGKVSAVMRQLHRSVVLKQELICIKAKLSIFRSSQVQAAEMGLLRRLSGLTLLDKLKSEDIRESSNIESLHHPLDISQLRWYGHVTRMFQKRAAKNCSVQHRLVRPRSHH